VQLSPADDLIIRVERPLDLDSEGLMIASMLAKKAAAGATHVVIDLPIGATAKVRSEVQARRIIAALTMTGAELGLAIAVIQSDGAQPVGRGIGPALEARDVLAVLRNEAGAPADLRARGVTLSGQLLELSGMAPAGTGEARANALLASGDAWRKFLGICQAQGGLREPPRATHTRPVNGTRTGRITAIDNRRLARLAKLTGAPRAPAAGLVLEQGIGARVDAGAPLCTLHAEAPGPLAYAMDYATANPDIFVIQEDG
jgi:thymidine phosphorylase